MGERIDRREDKLGEKPRVAKRLEKLENRIDKVLARSFLRKLEKEFNKGNIAEQAYRLLKEDVGWLIEN